MLLSTSVAALQLLTPMPSAGRGAAIRKSTIFLLMLVPAHALLPGLALTSSPCGRVVSSDKRNEHVLEGFAVQL